MLLDVKNVSVRFASGHGVQAVENVSLTVDKKEKVCIVGETGSGKSILLLAILHLLPENAIVTGEAFFEGEDLIRMKRRQLDKIRGARISYVPQGSGNGLNPLLTVGLQVAEPMIEHQKVKKREAIAEAVRLMKRFHIGDEEEVAGQYPFTYSGGMKQRAMIAMGIIAGADMILADDNFATIVSAVREGRGIFENIKKTVHFLLSCNIGEILTVFVSFLLHLPTPLLAIQLLWVNLVTDSLPALALGVEPIDRDIMERKPVKPTQSIFAGGMGYNILVEGCLIGAMSLLAYSIGRIFFDIDPASPVIGRTMAFAVLSFSQVVHTFNMRSSQSVFRAGIFRNKKLVLAAVVCVVLQLSVIVIPPLAQIFKTVALVPQQWLIVTALAFVPLVVVELEKAVGRAAEKRNERRRKAKGHSAPSIHI